MLKKRKSTKKKYKISEKTDSIDDKIRQEELEQITQAISRIVLEEESLDRQQLPEIKITVKEIDFTPPQTSSTTTNYWQSFYNSTNPQQYETYSKTYTVSESTTSITDEKVEKKIEDERRDKKIADTLQINHTFTYNSCAEKEAVAVNKLLNFSLNILLYDLERI